MAESEQPPRVDTVSDLQVPVTAVLAERAFPLQEILELRPGTILDFARSHRGPLDLLVNGQRVGRGRAVDVGDRLGFLLEAISTPGSSDSGGPKS